MYKAAVTSFISCLLFSAQAASAHDIYSHPQAGCPPHWTYAGRKTVVPGQSSLLVCRHKDGVTHKYAASVDKCLTGVFFGAQKLCVTSGQPKGRLKFDGLDAWMIRSDTGQQSPQGNMPSPVSSAKPPIPSKYDVAHHFDAADDLFAKFPLRLSLVEGEQILASAFKYYFRSIRDDRMDWAEFMRLSQQELSRFIASYPSSPDLYKAYSLRGTLRYADDQYMGALADFEESVKLTQPNITHQQLMWRGFARIATGDRVGACDDYRKSLTLGNKQIVSTLASTEALVNPCL